MKERNRKQVLDIFSEKLQHNFTEHCFEHKIPEELEHFITYLIDRELISTSTIKRYVILETFEDLHRNENLGKTHTVLAIADRFNLSSRSVWNALRKGI